MALKKIIKSKIECEWNEKCNLKFYEAGGECGEGNTNICSILYDSLALFTQQRWCEMSHDWKIKFFTHLSLAHSNDTFNANYSWKK